MFTNYVCLSVTFVSSFLLYFRIVFSYCHLLLKLKFRHLYFFINTIFVIFCPLVCNSPFVDKPDIICLHDLSSCAVWFVIICVSCVPVILFLLTE